MRHHSILIDVIVRPEYRVRYEQVGDVTFVHVDVAKWDHEVAARFRADIDAAHALLGKPVYCLAPQETPLLHKFIAAFGFEPCGTVKDISGHLVPIFGRPINGQRIWRWQPTDTEPVAV